MKRSEHEAVQASRPQALADLKRLMYEHSMHIEVVNRLLAYKTEAREYIAYFRRMTFLTNGSFMVCGLALMGFGIKRMAVSALLVGVVCLFAGMLIFWKFSGAFIGMIRALHATEAVARKHDLI